MHEIQFKKQVKIMKNYNWEYFKAQISKIFEPKKHLQLKKKLMWSLFCIYEGYFVFHSNFRSKDK